MSIEQDLDQLQRVSEIFGHVKGRDIKREKMKATLYSTSRDFEREKENRDRSCRSWVTQSDSESHDQKRRDS